MIEWWWILVTVWLISMLYVYIFIDNEALIDRFLRVLLSPFLLLSLMIIGIVEREDIHRLDGVKKLRELVDKLIEYKKGTVFLSVNGTKYEVPDDKKKKILAILLKEEEWHN